MRSKNATHVGVIGSLLLMLTGIALNQSAVVGGVNLSAADLLVPISLVVLAVRGHVRLPVALLLTFLLFSAFVLTTSVLVTPNIADVDVNVQTVLINYIKLLTCFLYFTWAYSAASSGAVARVLKAFTGTAIIVGLIGIIDAVVPGNALPGSMYYGSTRYQGLMNDPNYFAVVQLAAIAILVQGSSKKHVKAVGLMILLSSVLLSGSKTGFLALLVLIAWWLTSWTFRKNDLGKLSLVKIQLSTIALSVIGFIAYQVFDLERRYAIATALEPLPALSRLAPLFVDFEGGIQDGGSSRATAWEVATRVIELSPISGIGIGTYLDVSQQVTGERVLAHNSFLQLAAEWGMPICLVFFGAVCYVIVRSSGNKSSRIRSLRDACIVILVGSLGISLNNSRLFWVMLGALVATHVLSKSETWQSRADLARTRIRQINSVRL